VKPFVFESESGLEAKGSGLRRALEVLFSEGVERDLADQVFNRLACEVFRFQVDAVPAYGAMVRARGVGPDRLDDWRAIPPVPARAFRALDLIAGGRVAAEAVFRTSGTTGGSESRGTHFVRSLELYRAAILPNARAHLHPEGGPLRVLALTPSPGLRPESSLVHMLGVLCEAWDDGRGGFMADAEWRLGIDELRRAVGEARDEGVPVLLAGTAFAFVHLLDESKVGHGDLELPPGSRVMETGGFKGRSRVVEREALYTALSDLLAVAPERMVNEYGMTEMLSQFYERVLRDRGGPAPGERPLHGPPWVRTRLLDPVSLEPVAEGEVGLLSHLDLANLYSISPVLTEDLGVQEAEGFRVLGRREGAEPRGCSLAIEEMMAARDPGGR